MLQKGSVLVVDDSPLAQSSLSVYLSISGFKVDIATDGLDGLNKAKSQTYDLVFSDYEMPNLNGLQFVEKLKALTEYKNVPVIMLTTVDTPEVTEKAKSLGVAHFLKKPFTNEKMKNVLTDLKFFS